MHATCIFLVMVVVLVGGERWKFAEVPPVATDSPSVRFLFHGDWGWPGINQTLVAYQMGNWSFDNKAQFLIALGDNFYSKCLFAMFSSFSDIYAGT